MRRFLIALGLLFVLAAARPARAQAEDDPELAVIGNTVLAVTAAELAIAAAFAVATVGLNGVTIHDMLVNDVHDSYLITGGYAVGGIWIGISAAVAAVDYNYRGEVDPRILLITALGASSIGIAAFSHVTSDDRELSLRVVPTATLDREQDLAFGIGLAVAGF